MNKAKPTSPFRLASLLSLQKDPKIALQLFKNPNHNPNDTEAPPLKPFRYNLLHYDLSITKLGRAKMHQLKHDTRVIPEEIIFCNVISFYGRARLLEHALQVFDEMLSFNVQRTVKSFNTLSNALLTCGKLDRMKELFQLMEKYVSPDACSYNILIHGCVVSRRLEDAWMVFDEMLKKRLQPTVVTFGTLLYGLCLELRVDEALKLKEDMMRVYNVKPDGQVFASLIKGLCAVGELSLALGFKEEIVRNKIEMDAAIYSTLISALFKAGRKNEVPGILMEMKERGCRPNSVTYNALISGFCKENDFEAAFTILDEMGHKGCKANTISYNVILGGLCKDGKCSEAKDLFEDMPRQGCNPDVVSYRILFDGLCDRMRFGEAALILDEMIFKGFVPRSARIHSFVGQLCEIGNVEVLWTVLYTLIKGNVIDFDTWRTVISKMCKDDMLLNASQLVESLIRP
ncbi:putative pentatricopeptide repeat-containing protein [Citrus sinensis]|uniref:Pentatricopeptide repeat-containing protein n=1 Tax=Citrus sinensis TaxID=2711 RepID=A0ACB8M0E7_CITSI|nr:putative pentatricopeptide repeat-containing protein [Citrus sinensis]